jgi:hypothetical protein
MQKRRVGSVVFSLALSACVGGDIQGGAGGNDSNDDGTPGDNPGDGTDPDGPGDSPGGGGDDDPGSVCDQNVPIQVTQTSKTPDMLLVLDKSGSMDEDLGFSGTKMEVMKDALATVLPARDAEIRFGLMVYPPDNECGPGDVFSDVGPNNANAILAQVLPLAPEGATPTHTTLDAAGDYFASIQVNPDGRFVLLATDGLPNCNGANDNPSNDQTLAAARRLAASGIRVFVIGFGDVAVADPDFLEDLAVAGGTNDFFAANSPQALEAALQQISGTVVQASCDFALASTPDDPSKLAVEIDGQAIARDPSHQSGWDYDAGSNSVIFYGATCAQIQSGTAGNVNVDYGCGGPVVS